MTDVSFTGGGGSIGGALFTHGGTVNGDGVTFESNGNGSFDGGAATSPAAPSPWSTRPSSTTAGASTSAGGSTTPVQT